MMHLGKKKCEGQVAEVAWRILRGQVDWFASQGEEALTREQTRRKEVANQDTSKVSEGERRDATIGSTMLPVLTTLAPPLD